MLYIQYFVEQIVVKAADSNLQAGKFGGNNIIA